MKTKILTTILLLLIFFTTHVAGNVSGTISGKVIDDETGDPLEYVSVAVYDAKNESLITGTITDADGQFSIKGITQGEYYLEVTFIGYDKRVKKEIDIEAGRTEVQVGDIVLPRSAEQLDEVQVVADEMGVEYKIDRKVINVSQQLTAASGSAVDILENVPSITVDVDGNVALRGSTGFMVLIDGRPTVLEPSEALQQIPANTIENIEIITNPSAKYNPDGTAGIINIITKKDKLKGLSGTANLNGGNYSRYGAGMLLNYSRKKWNVFFGADLNHGRRPGMSFSERTTTKNDTTFYTESDGERNRERHFWVIRGGLGYNFTDRDIFNIEFNYGYFIWQSATIQDYTEWIEPGDRLSNYISRESGIRSGNFYSVSANFRHDFQKKGHFLSADVSYRSREGEDTSTNQLIDSDDEIASGQINTEDGPGNVLQLNLDYTLPVGENNKFEAGYQSRIGNSGDATSLSVYNPENGFYELQPEFTNETNYKRDIHSLYGIYASESEKFGYQVGLRGEYTYRIISSLVYNQEFVIDRLDYFPTLHTSYKLPSEQQLMASYSRRIERPRGWWLEPFITWEDAFNVRQGNPDLQPEYIDAMELGYMKGLGEHSLTFEGYYRITSNKVERIRSVYDDNVMMERPENVGKDYALGGELVLNLNLFKWWKADLSGNFYQYRLEGAVEQQVFDRQSFNWNSRLSNTFRFGKGTRIQLNSRYNSATVTAQGERGDYWTADLAVSQEFLNKSMTAIVQVRDIFGNVVRDGYESGPDFYSYSEFYNLAPQVALTLNYRFNNFNRDRNGSDGEGGGGDVGGEEF
ncbi:MAG: TonB-dependent receptor [Cyclobacteriaceae bacterium]|nr:TonB-dependent receptor [Cyclobacteriaceae bacterium]